MIFGMRRIRQIHLIGIGGSGMGGIAEVLTTLGYNVTGSDLQPSSMTKHLEKLGIKINYHHNSDNINKADVIVKSSAIADTNVELIAAKKQRLPIVPRAEMLAELMRFKQGIAVAGTHGKTTTTSLIATLFAEAKLDPTFVIGGRLNSLGSNAKLGQGDFFIAEADESDASFLHLNPIITVITNIDHDHMPTYGNDFEKLKQIFLEFIHRLPFYGLVVLCIDDPVIKELLPKISRSYITYGFDESADIRALSWQAQGASCSFELLLPTVSTAASQAITLNLNLPGKHNVLNALAAIVVALEANISWDLIQAGLLSFAGIKRRMQILGNFNYHDKEVLIIDDYGHHPQEVAAVIAAIRASWPKRRIVMIYQPHRYSRTQSLFEDFTKVLSEADVLLLLEVYSAGEQPVAGADSRTLCGSIRKRGKVDPIFVNDNREILSILANVIQAQDILVVQGAGSISNVVKDILRQGVAV